jgi:hypothetical protein
VAGIKRMIVHENFDYDTATNDICLLELQEIGRPSPVTDYLTIFNLVFLPDRKKTWTKQL